MRWLNYHHLYYFKVIAHEGGISNASKKLRLGQPALSAQLKLLEDSLGEQLFERKNRALFLTEAGEIVLEYANHIFKLGDELMEVIDDKTLASRRQVHIGTLQCIPKSFTHQLIQQTRKEVNCKVTVLEGSANFLLQELLAHKIDMMITDAPPSTNVSSPIETRLLSRIPISVFGTREFSHLKKDFPKSLEGQPMILPTAHSQIRLDIDAFFHNKKIEIDVVIETQDSSLQKILGITGMGLVVLPQFAGREYIHLKKFVEIGTLPKVTTDYWLVTAQRKIENPIATHIMKNFKLI
ncbi:MAG: LysR family transcriptional regulator [Bacteriovoracaceae bacterium]|nr:LysR family transcriptional regulator [Bacteriovoracaceae bacterium]